MNVYCSLLLSVSEVQRIREKKAFSETHLKSNVLSIPNIFILEIFYFSEIVSECKQKFIHCEE